MQRQFRQGHILLHPVRSIPKKNTIQVKPAKENHVVLATGETGREHVFKSERVSMWQQDGNLFIEVTGDEPVWLEHPEHGDIEVPPGEYRLIHQREAEIGFGPPRASFD